MNKNEGKKKFKGVTLKRVIVTAACVTVIFGGSNIYASTQGYKNIFFMIKDMINSKDTNNRDEILSDKDITISYENDKKKQELDQKESNENYKKKQELEQEELNQYYKKKEAIENYLNLTGAKEGGPLPVLIKLGLVPNEYVILNENVIKIDKYEYTQTNIKYSDFKNAVMNYMTEELFNKEFTSIAFKEKDGILCFLNAGGTGIEYEVEDFIEKGDYYEAQVYRINIDGSKELEKMTFGISYVGYEDHMEYVVSSCN